VKSRAGGLVERMAYVLATHRECDDRRLQAECRVVLARLHGPARRAFLTELAAQLESPARPAQALGLATEAAARRAFGLPVVRVGGPPRGMAALAGRRAMWPGRVAVPAPHGLGAGAGW
jgi:hypothetical protein